MSVLDAVIFRGEVFGLVVELPFGLVTIREFSSLQCLYVQQVFDAPLVIQQLGDSDRRSSRLRARARSVVSKAPAS
jgi:hypothetical protein